MDIRLREIAGKPAGTYFIVSDNSAVSENLPTSNLRLIPINVERSVVNSIVVFQQGDTNGLFSIFGKQTRKATKQGNFSIQTCVDALVGGPIAVINLRVFDDELDTVQVMGMSPNKTLEEIGTVPYSKLFNTNSLWTVKPKNISGLLTTENLLNFGNVGQGALSFMVTVAKNVDTLTDQGEETLIQTDLDIEDFPALDGNMLVKETFVDVYIFKNTFDPMTVSTNQYYGQLFNQAGLINFDNIDALAAIKESGFVRKVTGSVIPNLRSENDEEISIDVKVNSLFAETGLICYINDDVLENETVNGLKVINSTAAGYYDEEGSLVTVGNLYSHRLQNGTSIPAVIYPPVENNDIANYSAEPFVGFEGDIFTDIPQFGNQIVGIFENGVRRGDILSFKDQDTDDVKDVKVENLEITGEIDIQLPALGAISVAAFYSTDTAIELMLTANSHPDNTTYKLYKKLGTDSAYTLVGPILPGVALANAVLSAAAYDYVVLAENTANTSVYSNVLRITMNAGTDSITSANGGAAPGVTPRTATANKVTYTLSEPLNAEAYMRRLTPVQYTKGKVLPTNLNGYVVREAQFTNGSAARQNEILDMLNSPGIIKGIKNFAGVRYIVDAFKSHVEASYKYQYNEALDRLDKSNKFVRAIINEPFIEDLERSTNPLFKSAPNGVFDTTYLPNGGNQEYSTRFLNKPTKAAEMCFYFGSGEVVNNINVYPLAGKVSNLFINKTFAWDVLANASGYVDGIESIETNPDDAERKHFEDFRWNPIIKKGSAFTIYGNNTGQRTRSSLKQIHNSELLCYIKESLVNMSGDEEFKKGTYDDYLRLETAVTSFMNDLVTASAIQPNPVVICNASNNTEETRKAGIKVCRIEYYNIDALDKVVFDLELN